MSFSRKFKPKSAMRKNLHSKSEVSTPAKPNVLKNAKAGPNPVKVIEKEPDEYCDLSIVITNEEIYPEHFYAGGNCSDVIRSAKQSLIELQQEAKNCVDSSKRFLDEATKQLKSSMQGQETHRRSASAQINPQEMLRHLSQSILELNERLSINEEAIHVHAEENTTLKFELKDLEEKMKLQHCKLESSPMQIGCTCLIM